MIVAPDVRDPWGPTRFNLASGGETQFVDGVWASGSFVDTLGVPVLLGRTLSKADDRRGGGPEGPVSVISYSFWQRRFGGAGYVVGRTLALDHVPFTIVGVTPPDFFGADVGRTFDVIAPVGNEPLVRGRETLLDSGFYYLTIIGAAEILRDRGRRHQRATGAPRLALAASPATARRKPRPRRHRG